MRCKWNFFFFTRCWIGFWVGFLTACVSGPRLQTVVPLEELFLRACLPGKNISSVQGAAWLKVKTEEISGQFFSHLVASVPTQLRLEVTNFLGGTEAILSIQENQYTILRGSDRQDWQGVNSWAGVPLRWINELFLGRIPCPLSRTSYRLSRGLKGELVVDTNEKEAEKFIYSFKESRENPWPNALHWEKKADMPFVLDFSFDDPEAETLSPTKWEVRSHKAWMKVRWKNRKISLTTTSYKN